MDWTIVDVTDIADVGVGSSAVLIGNQGGLEIRAEDIAAETQTISYEITCGVAAEFAGSIEIKLSNWPAIALE